MNGLKYLLDFAKMRYAGVLGYLKAFMYDRFYSRNPSIAEATLAQNTRTQRFLKTI